VSAQLSLFELGTGFSEEQLAAIDDRGGECVLAANAGSGKTSVLVERFVAAVVGEGVAPSRILAITFTDRAAGELRGRVRARLLALGARSAAHECAAAPISTFHAFATRLLRSHPLLAPLPPDFDVLDEAESAALRERAFQLAFARWQERDGALDLAAEFGVDALRHALFAVYDERRSRGEDEPRLPLPPPPPDARAAAQQLLATAQALAVRLGGAALTESVATALGRLERCRELLAGPLDLAALASLTLTRRGKAFECAEADGYEGALASLERALVDARAAAAIPLLDQLLEDLGERFTLLKQARGGADFDDLELAAARLLREHPEIAQAWRERFERLMVDELQDTNARQIAILAELERDNLFTVGDAFQSIYAFRHADVEIFRERFARLREQGRGLVLSANYRSRTAILDGVNAIFAPLFGERFVPLRPGRTDAAGGPALELILTDTDGWDEHAQLFSAGPRLWRAAEARLLAARIDELIAGGEAAPGEIVVLLRAASEIGVYETEIASRGHATLTPAGAGFYRRPEIADLAAYLTALANPLDELALYGALASPLAGASSDALVELALAARERAVSPYAALAAGGIDERLDAFAACFAAARAAAPVRSLGEIVAAAIADHGYERYLRQLSGAERRVANVHKLVRLAREFEGREGRDLRRFADALAAGRLGSLREAEAPPPLADAVRLMTVHAAKGLEFPVVCLADLGHRPNRGEPRLLTDGVRVGLRLPSIERASFDALDYAELVAERRARASAEEQRIFYVAMTRARERLILSGAARLESWPAADQSPIAWLAPALVPDLAARLAAPVAGALVAGTAGVPLRLTIATATALAQPRPTAELAVAEPQQPAASPRRAAHVDPGRLSYTALSEYARCGYRYYLQRVLGLPDVAPPAGAGGGSGAARGTLVHALLERLDFAAPFAPEPLSVAATAAQLRLDRDTAGVAELVGAFARSPLCARLATASDVRREEPFAFAIEPDGELLRGTFDVIATEADGTCLIVDYKTDAIGEGEDLEAHVRRDYDLQRLAYALAALRGGAQCVEVAHCFLRAPQETFSARYEATDEQHLARELARRLAPLRRGDYGVTSSPGFERCATCPGRARLCSYPEALTLRASAGDA